MNLGDFLINNTIITSLSKFNSGYVLIDMLFMLVIMGLMSCTKNADYQTKIFKYIQDHLFNKPKKLIFCYKMPQSHAYNKEFSKRYQAIMHYISIQCDPTIKSLVEVIDIRYNSSSDNYEESKGSMYRVDQTKVFVIDNNIMGYVYNTDKEVNSGGSVRIDEYKYIEVFSYTATLIELQSWVEKRVMEHSNYLREKACSTQLLIDVSWNPMKQSQVVTSNKWNSNATFQNRFFTNKDKILEKINFFIENPEWYRQRGIPYTLGFLLHGSPGCGKTGFIKALMNLTGRHGISVKLNNKFNMTMLQDMVFNEEISNDIIIPQKNRIFIFEDIDCMCDIVTDRDAKSDTSPDAKINEAIKTILTNKSISNDPDTVSMLNLSDNTNNNLSYLLNILDGLQESPGRIIIMTTNYPEKLDKALIRAGRIDYNINFTKATIDDITNILKHFWEEPIVDELDSSAHMKHSHADIVNMCRTSENIKESIQKINL